MLLRSILRSSTGISRQVSHITVRSMTNQADLIEKAKKFCAYAAVDSNLDINKDKVIGIGSGSTVVYVAERVGQLAKNSGVVCVPTGFQSKQLIIENGLRLGTLEEFPEIDVAFDGADEIDSSLNCIKGGGGCLLQEKLVADSAKRFILVADDRKNTGILGRHWTQGVPIEVVPTAYTKIIRQLKQIGGKPTVRLGGKAKAGPVITDNGNFIIDCDFGEVPAEKLEALNDKLIRMVGIVETGYFVGIAKKAYIGKSDGTVSTLDV